MPYPSQPDTGAVGFPTAPFLLVAVKSKGVLKMADVNKVTLGNGTLYINGVDVGYLKGNVEFTYGRDMADFKPSNATGIVKKFMTGEHASLKASLAELKAANLRLAMGIYESVSASQSFPAYEGGPTGDSYSPGASASFDVLTFGGKKTVSEVPIRFEHERPDGKDVVVVLYKCVANPEITVPFDEENVILHDIAFDALTDTSRSAGDQIGFIADQVAGS